MLTVLCTLYYMCVYANNFACLFIIELFFWLFVYKGFIYIKKFNTLSMICVANIFPIWLWSFGGITFDAPSI